MNSENTIILNSLNNLIEHATHERFKRQERYESLYHALIKRFFNATTVAIDYDDRSICLGLSVLYKECEVKLHYDNLEQFLKSCVRRDDDNLTFYKNLLHYYNRMEAVA